MHKPWVCCHGVGGDDVCMHGGVLLVHLFTPAVDVGREHAADDVAEVWHVVNVWQRAGDEHVSGALAW
jgi:hypothetical protein